MLCADETGASLHVGEALNSVDHDNAYMCIAAVLPVPCFHLVQLGLEQASIMAGLYMLKITTKLPQTESSCPLRVAHLLMPVFKFEFLKFVAV